MTATQRSVSLVQWLQKKLSPVGFLDHEIHMRSTTDCPRRIDRVSSPSGHPWRCSGPARTFSSSSVEVGSESGIAPSSKRGGFELIILRERSSKWGPRFD